MAQLIDHERAKSAYGEVEGFVTTQVDLPQGETPDMEGLELKSLIKKDSQRLSCIGPMQKADQDTLKSLTPNDDQWKETVNNLYKKCEKKDFEKLKTWGTKFPGTLQACGLLQSLALCQEKSKNELYPIIARWLQGKFLTSGHETEVTRKVSEMDMQSYRHASKEAMAYMTWVKRAVSVLIPEQEKG